MEDKIASVKSNAIEACEQAGNLQELQAARIKFLGKIPGYLSFARNGTSCPGN